MDEAPCSSNSLAPFITKIYEMLEDKSANSVVSWSQSNKSFIVWNPPEFSRDVLPRYFKHSNFSSFIRQLNTYGFRKVDSEKWEFANEDFIRGQPQLLKNIHRRKPVHSRSLPNLASLPPVTEFERIGYKDEVERLSRDKESLIIELQTKKREQEELTELMGTLMGRVHNVENRHANMLSSLAQTLQRPALDFISVPEVNHRKRRFPGHDFLSEEESTRDVERTPQVLMVDMDISSLAISNKDLLDQLEASLMFWESLVVDLDLDVVDDEGVVQHDSPSMELFDSTNCASSPCISYTQLNVEIPDRTPAIDMNSEPRTSSVGEVQTSGEDEETTNPRAGVNDVFWEQFLTENPGSSDASTFHLGIKDKDSKKNARKSSDGGDAHWLNTRNVNKITEQLGNLTPAERT